MRGGLKQVIYELQKARLVNLTQDSQKGSLDIERDGRAGPGYNAGEQLNITRRNSDKVIKNRTFSTSGLILE